MERLTQVTRTDDKGGPVAPRELTGGCTILCNTSDCNSVSGSGSLEFAHITIPASAAYQRVLVAATISTINAGMPEPPVGPGSWTVTYNYTDSFYTPGYSEPYDVRGMQEPRIINLEWSGLLPPEDSGGFNGLQQLDEETDEWLPLHEVVGTNGSEAVAIEATVVVRQFFWRTLGPSYLIVTYHAENGGNKEDEVYGDG